MAVEQLPKILIVDDQSDGQRATIAMLRDVAAELHTASSGAEAIGIVMSHEIAVVLMEVQMPGLDGFATAFAMKTSRSMRQTPIIFITEATSEESTEFKGYEAGAVDYLYKPLKPNVLRAKVEVFLNIYRLQCEIRRQNVVLEERVAQRTAELEAVCNAAESASIAKGEFLANMSHEIRTPMTAILGFTEIVQEKVTDPESTDWLNKIQRNGDHLLSIINDILDISKIEANKLDIEVLDVSPAEILTDVASLMSVRASGKGLQLQVEFDGPIPQRIKSDPTRLRQILVNLTGNAIKFTEVGAVRLIARVLDADSAEPRLAIDVVDSGIGMTSAQISKLFQPFAQADSSTTRQFGGTGLGLTISKRLSEMLGGGISVQSVHSEGSTFSVTVSTGPLHGVEMVDSPVAAAAKNESGKKEKAQETPQLACRVLLAEDGPDNQRLISHILKKSGADVEVADNGQIALDRALAERDKGNPFDVILMDMQMPVLDGYGATARLRDAGYDGLVVALTAHAMNSDKQKCLDAGCDDFATKPMNRKKLVELVASRTMRVEDEVIASE